MLIQTFEKNGWLLNANLTEPCTDEPLKAYRGELILVDGEIADASGRRKPPVRVLQQAIILAEDNHLRFFSGFLENAADLTELLGKYGQFMLADTLCVVFVYDISSPVTISHEHLTLHLVPLDEGLVWPELMDLAALEKGDMKRLSSADKVFVIYRELIGFRPRGATQQDLNTAMAMGSGKQRALRGAV